MASIITIDGVQIKTPSEFSVEKYKLTKSGRVASGLMKMDIIAKKRKFLFSYDIIDSVELEKITAVVDGDKAFFPIVYTENGTQKTATVYSGAIKAKKHREGSKWYWTNVTFDLIEQ